jgi:hypothetical protein
LQPWPATGPAVVRSLDATRRAKFVSGPGGKPAGKGK